VSSIGGIGAGPAATVALMKGAADLTARWRAGLDRLLHDPPALALLGAIVVFVGVFGHLVVQRQERFGTIDFDLGINDQSIWLLAHGHSFNTIRGVRVFGHHATLAYYALVPLLWLGGGPNTWNVLQVAVLGASAIPVALLARRRFTNPWVSTALGAAWLMHPSVQYFVWETFHPEVMAIPFLLWAYLALDARRWTLGAVLLAGALLWKEDVALFVVGIGLLWILRRQVRVGALIMALGLTWFAVFAVWFVPHEAGGTTVYGPLYGKLGKSPSEVIFHSITHPGDVIDRLERNDAVGYARDLAVPFGFTPFAAPEVLIAGVPQFTINALTTANFTWDLRYHYQALPLAALALGMVEGVARLVRWRPRVGTGAVVFVLATSLAATSAWGPSPLGVRYRTGYWPLAIGPEQQAKEKVIAMLAGDNRGVSVDYNFAPHLSHRSVIYTFPNPWVNKNFGIDPTKRGEPGDVHWLAVNTRLLGVDERALFEQLLGGGEFEARVNSEGIVLAERVKPPAATGT
jgi:uncharacterized membrane protein